ncbi:transcription factor bHLH47-like [Nicotiana tabacum]|uniref:Transcription factor bHLH47-like n=1 Tax=Nicotiana tabacum TaxID=4097 RepID=A0A1S3YWE9_TOBAC|nr:PREDICTED: transcription factor bHLH47-like [Nicotiana tabacum]XP_016456463.1 PREDICTED: transcription factor bHLH47-like [Nicotiana tabacum]
MGAESPTSSAENGGIAVETSSPNGSPPSKKIQKKVPKRVHKAEREKLKREHLNELFLDLANALELSEQTNGKASILNETARFVKDMISQIKQLKRENTALLSESQYLSMEKKELQDDNSTLEAQIDKLEGEVKERVAETNLDLNLSLTETQLPQLASQVTDNFLQLPGSEHPFQQMQMMNSLYVVPLNSTPQAYPEPDAAKPAAMPTYSVKKPQARYPTPADVWPSQILE